MVCFYFYHPGGAPRFSWFSCVFIWWYFWCILMCSCVLFLVRFSRVFCRAFSGVFWWFCWWYFLCFSWCFFHCVLVLFSVLFFVLVPFLFYIRFPLVVVLFFAVLFFVVFGCFFRAFFRAFCGVFFVSFIVLFFVHFFVLFLVFFFEIFFFVPWVAPETNDHNILHFGPCFFRCFFWWSLLVKIGYTQDIVTFKDVSWLRWLDFVDILHIWHIQSHTHTKTFPFQMNKFNLTLPQINLNHALHTVLNTLQSFPRLPGDLPSSKDGGQLPQDVMSVGTSLSQGSSYHIPGDPRMSGIQPILETKPHTNCVQGLYVKIMLNISLQSYFPMPKSPKDS